MSTIDRLKATGLRFCQRLEGLTTKQRVLVHCANCGELFIPRVSDVLRGQRTCGCTKGPKTSLTWEDVEAACLKHGIGFIRPQGPLVRVKARKLEMTCRCGKKIFITAQDLVRGHTTSCGCSRIGTTKTSVHTYKELASAAEDCGGTLLTPGMPDDIIRDVHEKVEVRCRCGNIFTPKKNALLSGIWRSCGCVKSKTEEELASFLAANNKILRRDREILNGLELDVVLPDHHLAIEFHGLYWHSEGLLGRLEARRAIATKASACRTAGYRLIVIFEDEWLHRRQAVEGRLRAILGGNSMVLGARHCRVEELEKERSRELQESWHLQGASGGITLALMSKSGTEVAIAVFGRGNASRARNAGWELMRFCVKPGFTVPGALGKLLAAFKRRTPDLKGVVSYSDNRWSDGGVYRATGFREEGKTAPCYWYFRTGERKRYHRYTMRKSVLLQRYGGDASKTEWELAVEAGYNRVWDLGCTRWVWTP